MKLTRTVRILSLWLALAALCGCATHGSHGGDKADDKKSAGGGAGGGNGSAATVAGGEGATSNNVPFGPAFNDHGLVRLTPAQVGSSSTTSIALENLNADDTVILSLRLVDDSGQFKLDEKDCRGKTLGAHTTCTVQVTFAPAKKGAQIVILDVTPDHQSPRSVRLEGRTPGPPVGDPTPSADPPTNANDDG